MFKGADIFKGILFSAARQLYYTTRVHYDGDSGIITCDTYDQQQQRRNSFKMEGSSLR